MALSRWHHVQVDPYVQAAAGRRPSPDIAVTGAAATLPSTCAQAGSSGQHQAVSGRASPVRPSSPTSAPYVIGTGPPSSGEVPPLFRRLPKLVHWDQGGSLRW